MFSVLCNKTKTVSLWINKTSTPVEYQCSKHARKINLDNSFDWMFNERSRPIIYGAVCLTFQIRTRCIIRFRNFCIGFFSRVNEQRSGASVSGKRNLYYIFSRRDAFQYRQSLFRNYYSNLIITQWKFLQSPDSKDISRI